MLGCEIKQVLGKRQPGLRGDYPCTGSGASVSSRLPHVWQGSVRHMWREKQSQGRTEEKSY